MCLAERQLALQSAARDANQWRSSFEQVADWLTSKEAVMIGLQQLSCDFERLGQQSNMCEVIIYTVVVTRRTQVIIIIIIIMIIIVIAIIIQKFITLA